MPETPCLVETACPLEPPWGRAHVRAPRGDESFVAVPPLNDALERAHCNRERLAMARADIQGRDFAAVRQWARRNVLRAARDYTAGLAGVARPAGDRQSPEAGISDAGSADGDEMGDLPLFVSGHQPTLFHPGVWVKNFAVGGLAEAHRGISLNLVVDTDTLSGTTIRVPTGSRAAPGVAMVPFDEPRPRQPWEEARIVDRDLFASFPERVRQAMGDWGFSPLLPEFWQTAVEQSTRSESLAECITAARSGWERSWGCANLELPISRLCALEPFLWFAAHLLAHLPRFQAVYNQVLHEYRVMNRVRSRTHPVADLSQVDGWYEAPFRVWRAGDEVRLRVFARQKSPAEIELSDGKNVLATLPLAPGRDACCAVKELQKLGQRGIRFRTRALTTTMFARLFFADLFVHGIGGAKYDLMTDRIVARFFGLPAPYFLTMSATVQLPVPGLPVDHEDENRLKRQLRELEYNSDRNLPLELSAEQRALVAEKQTLVAEQNAVRSAVRRPESSRSRHAGSGYDRFQRLQEINRRLAGFTQGDRRRIEEELSRTRQQLAANAVLHDREYAFCLFPPEKLQRFLEHVCTSTGG